MKKAFLVFAVSMAAVVLKAGWVVYWDVDSDVEFQGATLYVTTGDNTSAANGTKVTSGGVYPLGTITAESTTMTTTPETKADISSWVSDSGSTTISGFYVGLYSYNTESSAWEMTASNWRSWSSVYSALEYSSDGGQITQAHTSVATFAPEPTSGLLSLIGFAVLALRRRRA